MTDTICALSSGAPPCAISLIRISGPKSLEVIQNCLGKTSLNHRMATRCSFKDPKTGVVYDEIIAVFFKGPQSFTGEDLLELHAHGGVFILQSLLSVLYSLGIRQAEGGEFSQRAFLNGKLDLAGCEGIAELIWATSEQQWRSAKQLTSGRLQRHILGLRQSLLQALSFIEARIDFPDEGDIDILPSEVLMKLKEVQKEIKRLRGSFNSGRVAREGLRILILGPPNAGKSTLLNQLIDQERALVSDEPGTTRDYLEEACLLKGRLFRFIDTAGIRDKGASHLEKKGMERALDLIAHADLVIYLYPVSETYDDSLLTMLEEKLSEKKCLKLATKTDQNPLWKPAKDWFPYSQFEDSLHEQLIDNLIQETDGILAPLKEDCFISSRRHLHALETAENHLSSVLSKMKDLNEELLAFELKDAVEALSSIVGEVSSDDILGEIFQNFCVGK